MSNLMGIAFNLEDPDNLLGKSGITLALLERGHEGLIQNTHHNPLNAGFPNGTINSSPTISIWGALSASSLCAADWKDCPKA